MEQSQEITSEQILYALESYESEAELIKDALETTSDVYVLSDKNGRVLWCNEKCGGQRESCELASCAIVSRAQPGEPCVQQLGERWFLIEQKELSNTRRMFHAKDITDLIDGIRSGSISIV